jgi:hypothetical protein
LRSRFGGNSRPYRPVDEWRGDESHHDDLDARVDAILEKVHKHGRESLTAREQAVLQAAAKRYKSRG